MRKEIFSVLVVLSLIMAACGGRQEEKKSESEIKPAEDMERKYAVEKAYKFFKEFRLDEPDWVKEVKIGSKEEPYNKARALYEDFQEIWDMLKKYKGDAGFWAEAGTSESEARGYFGRLGIEAAKTFLATLSRPWEERKKAGDCGYGEGRWNFTDGDKTVLEIIFILEEIRAKPEDIGTTSQELRQFVLHDFKKGIASIRLDIKEGRASQSDGYGLLQYKIREAIEVWRFTPYQLELIPEEIEIIKKEE